MMIDIDQEARREGVLFEGDWLPLVGIPVIQAKALLKDAGSISYFADAIVNDRQMSLAYLLQLGDRLEFVQRFGVKAGDDKPIVQAIGEAMVVVYTELLEKAATVRARNLSADHERAALKRTVEEWAVQQFGPPDASTKAILADIVERLQRIELVLGRGNSTGSRDHHAVAGFRHGEVMADGPQPPDRFWLFGKEYKGISREQWLLLKAIWPHRTAEIENVMEQVYGKNFKQEQEALRSLARRLTECLARQSCRVEVSVKKGHCTLDIYDESKKVASDRPSTV